jgi:hypothetical protein
MRANDVQVRWVKPYITSAGIARRSRSKDQPDLFKSFKVVSEQV